jgi:NADH-quinone oxidoreductase subunit E
MAFTLSPEREKKVDEILSRYPTKRAACIPLLHLCQEQEGWASPEIIAFVADRLGISTSEVQGVVTFYTMYHQTKPAPHVVWVCRTLSCDLMGGKAIQEHLEERFGCHAGENSADGQFTLKKAECLAGCGYAPMVQIDDRFYEGLTPKKLDAILDQIVAGRELPAQEETPWYQDPATAAPIPPAAPRTPSTPPAAGAPPTPAAPATPAPTTPAKG